MPTPHHPVVDYFHILEYALSCFIAYLMSNILQQILLFLGTDYVLSKSMSLSGCEEVRTVAKQRVSSCVKMKDISDSGNDVWWETRWMTIKVSDSTLRNLLVTYAYLCQNETKVSDQIRKHYTKETNVNRWKKVWIRNREVTKRWWKIRRRQKRKAAVEMLIVN